MDKYLQDLSTVIRDCSMDNTYKMVWVRSIVETCVLEPDLEEIHFDQLSRKIFGYYWNQSIFFDLEQGPNLKKRPEIHQIVKEKVEEFRLVRGYKPEYFSKVEDKISIPESEISTVLTKDVSWRFQSVGGEDFDLYDLDRKKRTIWVRNPDLIREYSDILFELINYRWTQKLEELNNSPKISLKVKGTDREKVRRKNTSKFKKYLDIENPSKTSFITGNPIDDGELSIDHVIPWSYLYSDDLWNLVYVEKSQNSSKNNRIPNEGSISELESRNLRLLHLLDGKGVQDKHTEELRLSIERDFVRKSWVGCKG